LDVLIDEILLTCRLEGLPHLEVTEPVDLLALAAEECARHDGVDLEGMPAAAKGDPRLLLRLMRNLLDNASRHGLPSVQVRLRVAEGRAEHIVRDHGPGLPEDNLSGCWSRLPRKRSTRLRRHRVRSRTGAADRTPPPRRAWLPMRAEWNFCVRIVDTGRDVMQH